MKYKTYKKQRYLFFLLSVAAYFLPYIIVTACLLPLVKEATGSKFAIGLAVVFINALPFLGGILRHIFSHVPFINLLAFVFLGLAFFFLTKVFQDYVYTFLWIEFAAALGSLAACVLWVFHRKYKRYNQTYKANKGIGLIAPEKEENHD